MGGPQRVFSLFRCFEMSGLVFESFQSCQSLRGISERELVKLVMLKIAEVSVGENELAEGVG